MKKDDTPSLSDLLKLAENAFSVLMGAGQEIKSRASLHRDTIVSKLELVTRDEFDAAFTMLKKTRQIQIDLEKRLTQLEKKSGLSSPQKRKTKKQIRPKK